MVKTLILAFLVATAVSVLAAHEGDSEDFSHNEGVVVDVATDEGVLRNIPSTTCNGLLGATGHVACTAHCKWMGFSYGRCLGKPVICQCYK